MRKNEPQERNALGVRSLTERRGVGGMGVPPRSRVLDSGAANKTKLTLGTCHCYLGIATKNCITSQSRSNIVHTLRSDLNQTMARPCLNHCQHVRVVSALSKQLIKFWSPKGLPKNPIAPARSARPRASVSGKAVTKITGTRWPWAIR